MCFTIAALGSKIDALRLSKIEPQRTLPPWEARHYQLRSCLNGMGLQRIQGKERPVSIRQVVLSAYSFSSSEHLLIVTIDKLLFLFIVYIDNL